MRRRFPSIALASLLTACSPVAVLNGLAPRVEAVQNVRYAPGDRHTLDIYVPSGDGPMPVVVFVYGGGWTDGSKADYRFVGAALAAQGYLTIIPDYRIFPETKYPVFLQDNAAAVAWAVAHAGEYGGDPQRLFLMGHSAGAYNVVMLTLDKQWLEADGLDPDHVLAGTIGLAGPYDFLPLREPVLQQIFAPAGDLWLTQPITYARGDAPPMLLAAGTGDLRVMHGNTERLVAAIRQDGGRVEERLYSGVDHAQIVGAIAGALRWMAPTMSDVVSFLRRS